MSVVVYGDKIITHGNMMFSYEETFGPETIGVVESNSFSSSDWTQEDSSLTTWTFNPSNIQVVGNAGNFTSLIRFNKWFSQSENFIYKASYTVDADGVFLGVGVKTVSTFSSGAEFYAYMSTNPLDGTYPPGSLLFIKVVGTSAEILASDNSNKIIYTNGDEIEVSLKNENDVFIMTFQNLDTSGPVQTLTYTQPLPFEYPATSNRTPSIFQPAFQCARGSFTIKNWSFILNNKKNIDLLIIGDSKSEGYYADTFAQRYAGLWQSNNPTKVVQVAAGSGNTTQDILNNMPEIILQNPANVALFIGRNDLANGVADVVWQANYTSITSQIEAIGSAVFHQMPTPDTVSQSSLSTFISSTYANIIPVPPTFVSGTDNADDVHPNTSGNGKIYTTQSNHITL